MLELSLSTSLSLETNNRLLTNDDNRAGNFSMPFTLPLTDANRRALGWPDQLDVVGPPRRRDDGWDLLEDGQVVATGDLVIRETGLDLRVVLEFGTTPIRKRLDEARLISAFAFGGERVLFVEDDDTTTYQYLVGVTDGMAAANANPSSSFVFAPYEANGWRVNFWNENLFWYDPVTAQNGAGPRFFFNEPLLSSDPAAFPGDFSNRYRAAPLVRLQYVIEAALAELGIPFECDFWDGETAQLVLLPTATLDRIEPGPVGTLNVWQNRFFIQDILPDISLLELLDAIATTFGLLLDVTPTGTVQLMRSERIVRNAGAVDITPRVQRDSITRTLDDASRYLLKYDPGEMRVFETSEVLGTVATYADLPLFAALPDTDKELVWFVEEQQAYYLGEIIEDAPNLFSVHWTFGASQLAEVAFGPAASSVEATELQPGIGHVVEYIQYHEVPSFREGAGYSPELELSERQKVVRLAFWRGAAPKPAVSIGPLAPDRPPFNYSLRVDGPQGLAAQWLQPLYAVKGAGIVVKAKIYADGPQLRWLLRLLNLTKVSLLGREYLVRRINAILPGNAPATLELLPV